MARGLAKHLEQIGSGGIVDASISNEDLANNAVSGTKVSLEFPVSYTGSPSVGNTVIQHGTATASDGLVTVSFGTAFGATPQVVITPSESGTLANQSYMTVAAGSFVMFGESGLTHSWIAIGSGRI